MREDQGSETESMISDELIQTRDAYDSLKLSMNRFRSLLSGMTQIVEQLQRISDSIPIESVNCAIFCTLAVHEWELFAKHIKAMHSKDFIVKTRIHSWFVERAQFDTEQETITLYRNAWRDMVHVESNVLDWIFSAFDHERLSSIQPPAVHQNTTPTQHKFQSSTPPIHPTPHSEFNQKSTSNSSDAFNFLLS